MEKKDIKELTLEELEEALLGLGEKKFRAKQVYEWVHQKLAMNFDEMTNLSKQLREKLDREYYLDRMELLQTLTSKDGSTSKFLFRLNPEEEMNGSVIESVLMKYHHGNSVCISSQNGCRMGCRFCASTLNGLERNLSASEMLDQVYHIQRQSGERVSNVVVMGTGEPLDNYEELLRFISMLSDEKGLHISQRNITVSTCGLVEQIYRLAEEKLQITLAISLHAPKDEIRRKLMPVAQKYSMEEIMEACDYYYQKTGRRISFEYSLVSGVNDSAENAVELSKLLHGKNCHVNLIPVNAIKERNFHHGTEEGIRKFQQILEQNHINATIRREMGADINAACGQLRKSYMDEKAAGSRLS
jgi:23S rRNA (adenine2503-C2)-methyltransferase